HEIEERGVRLVGLDHDVIAATELGVGTRAVQATADDEGRVQPAFGQDAGYQTGGGRLAVRTGYGYALLQAHELGQHHRARHHWNLALARGHHFGVVRLHGSGSDDRVGADHMTGRVAQVGLDSQTFQASQRGAV